MTKTPTLMSLVAAEVLSRAAGTGELTITESCREDGSLFVTATRAGGVWGAATVEGVACAIVSSLLVPNLTQDQHNAVSHWSASEMGKKGSAARTEAKRAASAANGKKGGRPKKTFWPCSGRRDSGRSPQP